MTTGDGPAIVRRFFKGATPCVRSAERIETVEVDPWIAGLHLAKVQRIDLPASSLRGHPEAARHQSCGAIPPVTDFHEQPLLAHPGKIAPRDADAGEIASPHLATLLRQSNGAEGWQPPTCKA